MSTATGQILLGLLATGPRHGYELKREHDRRFPAARPLAYGQVYATLARLQRHGLVETAETSQKGGPERTVYALTRTGERALRAWLGEVEPPAPFVANPLFARTVVALLADGSAGAYLRRQREAHLERVRELTRSKQSKERDKEGSLAFVLAVEYALAHLDADLRWIEETTGRLGQLAQETRAPGS